MEYFINGEIYLKKGPQIFNSKTELQDVYDKISDLEFDISKENPDFSKVDILEYYEKLTDKLESWDGRLNYGGTNKFWQIFATSDNKIKLVMVDKFSSYEQLFNNINEVNDVFIKLSDFLDKSVFVGKEFKRTKHILSFSGKPDVSFTRNGSGDQYVVLYAMQDLFLVRELSEFFGEKYILLNSRYTLDGNYEFFGEIYEEYRDKAKLYDSILEQINSENKNKHLYRHL